MDKQAQINRRILVIDDNSSIHDDFRKILCQNVTLNIQLEEDETSILGKKKRHGANHVFFEIQSAHQGKEGLAMMQQALKERCPYALAFVDIRMPPGWDGIETVVKLWQCDPQLQVVICTAYSDYSWEEMIQKLGHTDNFVILKKPFDTIEVLQLANALTRKWHLSQQEKHRMETLKVMVQQRTAELESANASMQKEIAVRRQAEVALRLSEERFSKAFKASPIPIVIMTMKDTRHIDVNNSFLEMTGFEEKNVIGYTPEDLCLWEHSDTWNKIMLLLRETNSIRNLECQIRTISGQLRETLVFVEVFNLADELHLLVIIQDITERMQLEMQLRQQNKIQAVGQLSAGIAHDFNNLLTVIQGHASMYLVAEEPHQDVLSSMKEIAIAADKAAQLTRQLLAFSRKQIMRRGPLDMADVVRNMSKMVHRIIGENIKFELDLASDLPLIFADVNQIEQVIMNLIINARDAMPNGGVLTFRAKPVVVDGNFLLPNCETKPGHYVCFSVADNGTGIEPEIQPRIFEPFFTTKDVGKGSGMGLAMVDGIVKQHGGWIHVTSQVNKGSIFEIYFPVCHDDPVPDVNRIMAEPKVSRLRQTILFVEDEPGLLKLGRMILTRRGYRIYTATNGCEALDVWKEHKEEIDLLLTDIVMPEGISGKDLAHKLISEKKQLKVIFTSGYTSEILDQERGGHSHKFLPKPFQSNQLLETVNACLNPTEAKPRFY